MSVPPSSPHDTQAVIAVMIAIAAAWSVVHWRAALTVMLIAVLALIIYGVLIGFHDVSSMLAALHQ